MQRRSRVIPILAVPLLLAVACHGDSSSDSSDPDTSSTSSAVTRPPLTVPTTTILADTTGVLAPKGDGSVTVDDRGQVHEHIPIWVPPGRAGIQPDLAIEYSSNAGNGMVGTGWGLTGLPRITRCPGLRRYGVIAPPVEWNTNDSFCLDGEQLQTDSDHVYYYKFRFDGSRLRHLTTPVDSWEMRTKDGQIVTFGGTTDSRLTSTPAPTTWAVSRVQDRAGNFMTVSYTTSAGGDLRPSRIDYTGSTTLPTRRYVVFNYETTTPQRPDIDQREIAGRQFTYPDRLHSIEMHAPNSANKDPLRSFSFGYTTSPTTGRSRLTYVAECAGATPATLPVTGSVPLCRQQTFTYEPGVPLTASNSYDVTIYDSHGNQIDDVAQYPVEGVAPNTHLLDVDGDGRDDLLYLSSDAGETYHLRLAQPGAMFGPPIVTDITASYPLHLPDGSQGPQPPIVLDFNGDGHADVLVNQGESHSPLARIFLANNAGGTWTLGGNGYEYTLFTLLPLRTFSNFQATDLNGDGRPDLVMLEAGSAYYSLNNDGTYLGLTSPPVQLPGMDAAEYINGLNNYFMDFNNDGATEVMTRRWSDTACRGQPIGHTDGVLICNCGKMGFGAIDADPHLYTSFGSTQPPVQTAKVSGLNYCKLADDGSDLPGYPTYSHLYGDFNGDGIVDALEMFTPAPDTHNDNYPMTLQLRLGAGNQSFTTQGTGSFQIQNPGVIALETLDADGDGKTDLLVRGASPTTYPYAVWSWKNQSWHQTPMLVFEQGPPTLQDQSDFAIGDVDGDGVTDFVGHTAPNRLALYTRHTGSQRADLLTSTSGDFTPTTTVAYQPYHPKTNEDRSDCKLPLACTSRVGFVVKEIDTDNGLGNGATNAVTHDFESGRSDTLGWGFLGFKKHTITDVATGAITTRMFDFTRYASAPTPFYPFVGQPMEVDTTLVYQSGSTNVTRLTTTANQYEVRSLEGDLGPFMTNPTSTRTTTTDSNTSQLIDERFITRTFDPFGDQTYERDQFPLVQEERSTTTTLLDDWTNWIIGRPTYVSTTSSTNVTITGATSQTRETAYTYDALGELAVQIDNPGAANGSSYDPLPIQDDGVQTLYTRYTRDANGLPHIVEQLDNLSSPTYRRATQYDRDASEGMFVIQTTDPVSLVTQDAYDPGLGVIAAHTDSANLLTTFQYDTFGRIRTDHPPAGGGRVVAYHAAASGTPASTDDHRSGQYNTKTMLDSLRRPIQTITTGRADGKAVYVETSYDNLGHVATVSRAHFSGVTPAKTTTTYDKLGRVTRVQSADNSVQTLSYLGLTVTTTNPDGNLSAVTNDMLGRPVTSVQATTTGPSGLSGHVTTTTLAYGPFDSLVSSTDTAGNIVTSNYDRRARLRWKQDPDHGVTFHTYNVFGELSAETLGARRMPVVFGGHVNWIITGGTETDLDYDGDGRVKTKATPDMTQTFTYDSAMAGQLTSVAITGGPTISYTYVTSGNGVGSVKTKMWAGPRGSIGYQYAYDTYNRLLKTTYPLLSNGTKGLILRNTYSGGDVGGQLTAIDDVTSSTTTVNYWTLTSTDASEQFPVLGLRNGVAVTYGEDPGHPGWAYTIVAKKGSTTEQSLRYTREGGGRVQKREDLVDTAHPITETFGYDGLERLISWNWTGSAGARGVSYYYDDLGNLERRTITAGPGASETFGYGSPFGPHQLVGDSLGTTYDYDEQGNQLVAPGRIFTWNTFDRPTRVSAAAGTYTMTYDGDLARFSRTDPSGHTRYSYGGLFEELTDAAGTHDVMTIMGGGKTVGEKEVTNNSLANAKTNTVLVDALGSIDAIVTATGRQAIKYDPFGARVTATDPTVSMTTAPQDLRAGFTGHDHDDDINLIDMIGRVYDPITQRFLSVDPPAPDPVDGQAYNPYAYVRNNPLNATDPTGYLTVMLGGLPWRDDGNPATLLQMGYAPGGIIVKESDWYSRPGISLESGSQGSKGDAGTGNAAGSTTDSSRLANGAKTPGTSTTGGQAPTLKTRGDILNFFGVLYMMQKMSGVHFDLPPGMFTASDYAQMTEILIPNHGCGRCTSDALLMGAFLRASKIDSNPEFRDIVFKVRDSAGAVQELDHAVAVQHVGNDRKFISAGEVLSRQEFEAKMTELQGKLGAFEHKVVYSYPLDQAFSYLKQNTTWMNAQATCNSNVATPLGGQLANPYLNDPGVQVIRQVINAP